MTTYPSVRAQVNGKPYLAVGVNSVTYLIWTVAIDTGCNITKSSPGDVEINGSKPPQVFDGNNTYIAWSSIPSLSPNPSKDVNGVWHFSTNNVSISPVSSGASSSYPILDLSGPNIRSFVYAKTNVGGWFFDAILNATHTSTLTITDHPVQTGSSISDHAFMQPKKLSMTIGMSDAAKSFIPGQFSGGSSRSVEAWKVLQQLQAMRIPIQVYTRLGLYPNMLIQSLSTPDDHTTTHGLRCTVDFQELLVAQVRVVKVSSNPAVTDNSAKGTKQPQSIPPSILSLLGQLISGGK